MAKLFIADAALHNAMDALHVHGAYWYKCEVGLERGVRDALGCGFV